MKRVIILLTVLFSVCVILGEWTQLNRWDEMLKDTATVHIQFVNAELLTPVNRHISKSMTESFALMYFVDTFATARELYFRITVLSPRFYKLTMISTCDGDHASCWLRTDKSIPYYVGHVPVATKEIQILWLNTRAWFAGLN